MSLLAVYLCLCSHLFMHDGYSFKISRSEPSAVGLSSSYCFPKSKFRVTIMHSSCKFTWHGMHTSSVSLQCFVHVTLLHVLINLTRAFREHIFCALWVRTYYIGKYCLKYNGIEFNKHTCLCTL